VPEGTTDANGGGTAGTPATTAVAEEQPKFTQADVDRLIATRLGREREQAEARTVRERERLAAAQLEADGQFKTLAEQHMRRVDELAAELTQHETILDRYAESLRKINKTRMKDWPDEAKALVPRGDEVDPVDQAEAIERAAPLVARLAELEGTSPMARVRPFLPGNAPAPRPAAGTPDTSALDAERAKLRQKGIYAP
jgi:hypothetical protein